MLRKNGKIKDSNKEGRIKVDVDRITPAVIQVEAPVNTQKLKITLLTQYPRTTCL